MVHYWRCRSRGSSAPETIAFTDDKIDRSSLSWGEVATRGLQHCFTISVGLVKVTALSYDASVTPVLCRTRVCMSNLEPVAMRKTPMLCESPAIAISLCAEPEIQAGRAVQDTLDILTCGDQSGNVELSDTNL